MIEERLAETGPRVYEPRVGDVREGFPALLALLDFALGTDHGLTKPSREMLIARVAADFFPNKLHEDPKRAKQQVRASLADARRRAANATRQAAASGAKPFHAQPTFTMKRLVASGIVATAPMQAVADAPNGKGVRFVLETPPGRG